MSSNIATKLPDDQQRVSQAASAHAGAGAALATVKEPGDLIAVLARSLRGRYGLTIGLCLLLGGVGAALGWRSAGPLYQSEGMVRIASAVPGVLEPNGQDQPIPMFDSFMQAQQEFLTSRSLLESALHDAAWDTRGISRPSVATMGGNLKVEVRPHSENLRISYEDQSSSVAATAVATTITAYQKAFEEEIRKSDAQRIKMLEDYRVSLAGQIKTVTDQINAPAKSASVPVEEIPAPSEFEIPSPAKVALSDPLMARLLERREEARDQLDEANDEFGPNHPYVQRLSRIYALASQRVDHYLAEYISRHPATEGIVTPTASSETTSSNPNTSVDQMAQELDRIDRRIELLKTEATMPKRFEVVDIGDLPVRLPNRQIKWTLCGAGGGCGLVLSVMVALGMIDRRIRMCADVMEALGQRTHFVAAVPNLTSSSKPRHLEGAAQSIHYFRHVLRQKGAAYMVSSADFGEGRTTIAMSLAISLCGAGVRTLLIDGDFATRALSRAMKMEDQPGFVEMLHNSDMVCTAETPSGGLAILPAGAATEADGLSISAVAVARVIKHLKSKFDCIVMDAGPALGRVEACEIAGEVDGVVLAVCRGQKQSLCEETVEELASVGTICGAIFNRADPKDFERSVHRRAGGYDGQRLRTVAGAMGNLGPLVRAVALSLPHDVELFPVSVGKPSDMRKVA